MRPHIVFALLSILSVLMAAGVSAFSGQDFKEIVEFAVTKHNLWVPTHKLKLVSVDKFESKVLIPNVSVIYKLVLTTTDTVGIAKKRYDAVVKVVSVSSTPSRGFKQLLSFLPKLT